MLGVFTSRTLIDIAESFPSEADELDNGKYHLTIIDDNQARWN